MAVGIGPSSGNPIFSTYDQYGPQLLSEGKITMAELNNAVRHVLTLKYLAGMFSNPYQGSDARVAAEELTPAHLSTARSIADESEVLLNNSNHALPLSTSTSKIAVVGPLADDALDQLGPDVPIGYDTTAADSEDDRQDRHGGRRDQGRGPGRLGDHGAGVPHVHGRPIRATRPAVSARRWRRPRRRT